MSENPAPVPLEPTEPTSAPTPGADPGARLLACEGRLRLLVHHLAGRAILARVEVEDLVQEVFLRALEHPGSLPPRAPDDPGDAALSRWLATVARNTVVDAARAIRAGKRDGREERLGRADWSHAGPTASRVPAAGPGPATRLAGAETHERLVRAYLSLSPDHRRVIGLRQLEGLSAARTAERMGRSETAVHSLYRRALEAWDEAGAVSPRAISRGSRGESGGAPRPDGT